jgi:hypothetical protein
MYGNIWRVYRSPTGHSFPFWNWASEDDAHPERPPGVEGSLFGSKLRWRSLLPNHSALGLVRPNLQTFQPSNVQTHILPFNSTRNSNPLCRLRTVSVTHGGGGVARTDLSFRARRRRQAQRGICFHLGDFSPHVTIPFLFISFADPSSYLSCFHIFSKNTRGWVPRPCLDCAKSLLEVSPSTLNSPVIPSEVEGPAPLLRTMDYPLFTNHFLLTSANADPGGGRGSRRTSGGRERGRW